jgi:pantothenate kinase
MADNTRTLDYGGAVERARQLAASGDRVVVGITGPPGCGKSTLASEIRHALGTAVAAVPMDGFHLANAQLRRLGLAGRKGSPETFDAAGYISLLRRLREPGEDTVYAPTFDRTLEEPVAGAIAVDPGVNLVVTEGNYLLLEDRPWSAIRQLVDEVWFCDVDEDLRRARLVARHEKFGKTTDEALSWVTAIDEPNARLIATTRKSASYFIRQAGSDRGFVAAEQGVS